MKQPQIRVLWHLFASPAALAVCGLCLAYMHPPQAAPSPFVATTGPPLPPPLRVRWGLGLSPEMTRVPDIATSSDCEHVVIGAITYAYEPEPFVCARIRAMRRWLNASAGFTPL